MTRRSGRAMAWRIGVVVIAWMAQAGLAWADVEPPVYQMGTFRADSRVHLFGDQVNLRSRPDAKAPVLTVLPIGTALTVVGEPVGRHRGNGFESGWYQVRGGSTAKPITGFVWGGLLALASLEWSEGSRLSQAVAGITRREKGQFAGELRWVEAGAIKAQVPLVWINTAMGEDVSYSYSVAIEEIPWRGDPRFCRVLQIACSYDACGYARGKILFFWDGKTLVKGPSAEGVSEAGVFSVESRFVLPPDEGLAPDEIMVRTVTEEDGDEEGKTPASAKQREIRYRFTGTGWREVSNRETPLPPPQRPSSGADPVESD